MKKSSVIIITLLLLLTGGAIYIYSTKSKPSTVEEDSRMFRYKDTAAITKIFLADKDGNKSTLLRTKGGWIVNDKYPCRRDGILNLMEAIKNMEVRMSVPKAAKSNVIRYLATQSVKVEIYAGDELVRQYYVGYEAEDGEGSYMLLTDVESGKNYPDPYICFIPGFKGYLQPRFIVNENDWRDRIVMNYTPPEIKRIKNIDLEAPVDSSFTIDLENANSFKLKNGKGVEVAFDDAKMRQYLIYFQNVSYEVLQTGKSKKLHDSLSAVQPFYTIDITTTNFKTDEYKFYRKQFAGDEAPEKGFKFDYDPDRLYMNFNHGKDWALIQYYTVGKLFTSVNYFTPSAPVKK
ncbi:MAG: hypothetical protein JNL60_18205 [Bacteroidia bacterium]|nr:hypothetical protein [Bacteroidia bacterium]